MDLQILYQGQRLFLREDARHPHHPGFTYGLGLGGMLKGVVGADGNGTTFWYNALVFETKEAAIEWAAAHGSAIKRRSYEEVRAIKLKGWE